MVVYELKCAQGHRFEAVLESMFADNPPCPKCHSTTSRVPAMGGISGQADAGVSREDMPKSWAAVDKGDPEAIKHWRKKVTEREKIEAKHPELAGDRRPILAHEGIFANNPLRAGDPLVPKVAEATFGKKKKDSPKTDKPPSN